MQTSSDTWDPDRYDRFLSQREQPALDLLALVQPSPAGRVADLGCGTGRYTRLLHERTGASETVGIDSSAQMLARADDESTPGVRFELGDLTDLEGNWDVLYANASLQWCADHHALLPRLVQRLRPGGQIAFQVPSNYGHPSHVIAQETGRDFDLEPFDDTVGVLDPAAYAEVLHAAGLRNLDVSLRIYGHEMSRTDEIVEWVSGTLLTSFERRLSVEDFAEFRTRYRTRLLAALGDPTGGKPYFYAFPRILMWGRRPA